MLRVTQTVFSVHRSEASLSTALIDDQLHDLVSTGEEQIFFATYRPVIVFLNTCVSNQRLELVIEMLVFTFESDRGLFVFYAMSARVHVGA